MSKGRMTFALDQLNPQMRKQAEDKMRELGARRDAEVRNVIVRGRSPDKIKNWKETPRKKGSAPLLPQLKKDPKQRLAFYLRVDGLGQFELEHRFHPERHWRIDVAFVADKLAIEIEGVTPQGGRHQRIAGFRGDIKKYNALTEMGWRLLRYMPEMVSSGYAVNQIKRVLEALREERRGESARNGGQEETRTGPAAGRGHRQDRGRGQDVQEARVACAVDVVG